MYVISQGHHRQVELPACQALLGPPLKLPACPLSGRLRTLAARSFKLGWLQAAHDMWHEGFSPDNICPPPCQGI